jgi:hypothetical protein
MRPFFKAAIAALCLALCACSSSKAPPVGRWEGTYEASDAMVAVRLEITPKGNIFLSAPDALNIDAYSEDQRVAMRQRLAEGLETSWGDTQPRRLEFNGRVFRKPGGIAPQMEWNPNSGEMTVIVYLGTHPAIRIPMRAVKDFDSNPWPG